ncbi:MAG: ABC transporter permease [Pyrinomonadaceae bacterium]
MNTTKKLPVVDQTSPIDPASAGPSVPEQATAFRNTDHSLLIIDADNNRQLSAYLREIWRYRELLYFLTWRDIKIRYKQTLIGATWAVMQPLFTMLIFTLFFGKLARMPSDDIPYPLFAYSGILPWTFFANAVNSSSNSLVGNTNLITKIYFPRVIIPASAVAAGLLDFAIAFILLIPMLIYYQVSVTWSVLMVPVFVLLATLLALGVGMWASALNVRYRDVRYALPFLIQLWLFASPVIYPASILPQQWKWLLSLNPLTGIIEGFRAALFGKPFDAVAIMVSVALALFFLLYSAYVFRRVEDTFADIV